MQRLQLHTSPWRLVRHMTAATHPVAATGLSFLLLTTTLFQKVWNLTQAQRGFILLAGSNDIQKHTLTHSHT